MIITIVQEGNTLKVTPKGHLDGAGAAELDAELKELPEGTANALFDFSKLDYISSAGLRSLVSVYRKLDGGELRIVNANSFVQEVLEVTGLNETFIVG